MRKLLLADLHRLLRDKLAWFALAGATVCISVYDRFNYVASRSLWSNSFLCLFFLPLIAAVVGGLFVSVEQSDGMIRAKVISGAKRSHIYLSAFLVQTVFSLVMLATYYAVYLLLSLGHLHEFLVSAFWVHLLLAVLLLVVFAALCTLLEMLIPNRAVLIVILLILLLIALLCSSMTLNSLMEPEFLYGAYHVSIDGTFAETDPMPNPDYVQPEQRAFYELALDVVPLGNMAPIFLTRALHPTRAAIFSVIDAIVLTLLGLFLFCRADLR